MREVAFPAYSQYVRLFKTPQSRQDEYVVIQPLDGDDYLFTPQTYRTDRDINDMLMGAGIPIAVVYPTISDAGRPKMQRDSILSVWRRQANTQAGRLNGLCYVPGGEPIIDNLLNMYKEVSVPALSPPDGEETIRDFLDHLHTNICNGRTEYYTYLLRWLAHMVQFPAVRPKTAIAVIGDQGTGKGIFIDFLKLMLGGDRNCNTTASSSDTKSFNYAIANKLFVVFDEATFAGDRQQSDFMKKLVTEPRIRVEPKGVDAYEVDNFARVFITSNNMTSAVPAGIGGRRWLIMECRNDVDSAWLKRLATRIGNNGSVEGSMTGYASFFKDYLESIDLTDFDPLVLPTQNTGFETKLNVLYREDPVKAFLWEWLTAENLTLYRPKRVRDGDSHDFIDLDHPMPWSRQVTFGDFYAIFKDACDAAYAPVMGQTRMRRALKPYSMNVFASNGNVRFISLPHPKLALDILRSSARFDDPISPEQLKLITHAWARKSDDADGTANCRDLTPDEKERQDAEWDEQQTARELKGAQQLADLNNSPILKAFGLKARVFDGLSKINRAVTIDSFDGFDDVPTEPESKAEK